MMTVEEISSFLKSNIVFENIDMQPVELGVGEETLIQVLEDNPEMAVLYVEASKYVERNNNMFWRVLRMDKLTNNPVNRKNNIKDSKELEFAVFCIENIAQRLNADAEQIYSALKDGGILYGYIIPEYEMLHTQSKEYIVEDVLDVMKEKGIKL